MLRIFTITTAGFLIHTKRLLYSLESSGNSFHLTVFCDDAEQVRELGACDHCSLVELPELRSFGVKRGRFAAYARALEDGPFIYLDSDIIVLEPIDGLWGHNILAGCYDDLSECPYLKDKQRPWPKAPELVNNCYINAGVLYFPSTTAGFVNRMRDLCASDAEWQRYAIQELTDNHFLCAQLNRFKIPVHFLDENIYNWPGFIRGQELQVIRQGNRLINRTTGQVLRLVHLAGRRPIDDFICSLPVEISSLILYRSSRTCVPPQHAFMDFLGSVSNSFDKPLPDPQVSTFFTALSREMAAIVFSGFRKEYSGAGGYLSGRQEILAAAWSKPPSECEWNGLACGGPHLDGQEYNYLARLIEAERIHSVLELGAGETSILFRRLGLEALSLVAAPGPALDKALAAGCNCRLIPIDSTRHGFETGPFDAVLREWKHRRPDLLYIDFPGNSSGRLRVLAQLLAHLRPRWILFRDAHRDVRDLFSGLDEAGLELAEYFASDRGLALCRLKRHLFGRKRLIGDFYASVDLKTVKVELRATLGQTAAAPNENLTVRLFIENQGNKVLSSRNVCVSYHWFDAEGNEAVHDGTRTSLPFDILPKNSAKFPVRITAPDGAGSYRCQICLMQENVKWFDDPENSAWLAITVLDSANDTVATQTEGPPEQVVLA